MNLLTIIDYGCGNIRSVYNAFNLISEQKKLRIVISSNKSDIERSSHLVLPGVGSYETCINGLRNSNLIDSILKKVNIEKKPFLGICVGMQMLANSSDEGGMPGLGWVDGKVVKFDKCMQNIHHEFARKFTPS